jgi:hypothetical protein
MAKQGQRAEVNTFIQGLITEASPLNFPPNASKEEENFELFKDGTRRRRKGMDLESNYLFRPSTVSLLSNPNHSCSYHEWESVSGDPNLNFVVISFGNTFYVYNPDFDDLSNNGYVGAVYPTAYESGPVNNWNCASVDGKLVAVGGQRRAYVISYDKDTNALSFVSDTLKVRDFWGIETPDPNLETDVKYQPTDDYIEHRYNLANQSWGVPRKDKVGAIADPVEVFHTEYSKYPSNSEVVWTGLQYQPVVAGADPYERIFPNLYKEVFAQGVPASKGYFVIDLLRRGESREQAFIDNYVNTGLVLATHEITAPDDITTKGSTCVAEYAGRVFYAGFNGELQNGDSRSPNLSNYVVFSQVVKNTDDIFNCYQVGDPTSRDGSDIVDTDGGFLRISGASNLVSLKYIGNSLIVLAENGIWAISGGSDYGFTATNYKVTQISSFGCSSPNSVVIQGDAVLYWGDGGIYSIGLDKVGVLSVTNLTQTTIQQLYDKIPKSSRDFAFGIYDEATKKARWIFKEGTAFTTSSVTKELVLDFNLGNFTLNRIAQIMDNEVIRPFLAGTNIKYVTIGKQVPLNDNQRDFTFSDYNNLEFTDWERVDGTGKDAKAFMLTGSQIAGDSAIHKQIPYAVIHFERTETSTDEDAIPNNQSSCLVQFYWDWAYSGLSNKVTSLQQAYKYRKALIVAPFEQYDNGFEVITSRLKIRGRGRSFAMYIETEPKKDCHILGWNLTLNGDPVA